MLAGVIFDPPLRNTPQRFTLRQAASARSAAAAQMNFCHVTQNVNKCGATSGLISVRRQNAARNVQRRSAVIGLPPLWHKGFREFSQCH